MDLRHLEAFATKTDNQRIMFGTPSFQETSPSEDDRWSKYVEVQEGRWEHYRPRESQGIPGDQLMALTCSFFACLGRFKLTGKHTEICMDLPWVCIGRCLIFAITVRICEDQLVDERSNPQFISIPSLSNTVRWGGDELRAKLRSRSRFVGLPQL